MSKKGEYRDFLLHGSTEKPLATEVFEEAESDAAYSTYIRITDSSRAVIVETPHFPDLPSVALESFTRVSLVKTALGIPCSIGNTDVLVPDVGLRHVSIAIINPGIWDFLGHFRLIAIIAVACSMLIASICGRFLAKRGTSSIAKRDSIIGAIGPTRLSQRVDLRGFPHELAILGARFNAMVDRLEDAFIRLDHFSADIAHELRTPVNNLTISSELALERLSEGHPEEQTFVRFLTECQRLSRLINSLLLLAKVESPQVQLLKETLDVDAELRVVTDYYEMMASDRGIHFSYSGVQASIMGDRLLFQRMLGNLIENALAHTPADESILLEAKIGGDRVVIQVIDSGSGIAEQSLRLVFDRFRREGRDSSGRVGLGLPITRAIAAVHGGTVELRRRPGKGTIAEIIFPKV